MHPNCALDLLLYQAFPRKLSLPFPCDSELMQQRRSAHPHTALSLPAIEATPLDAILFSQVPILDVVLTKVTEFIDAAFMVELRYERSHEANSRKEYHSVPQSTRVFITF
jgi:hypothetical protein